MKSLEGKLSVMSEVSNLMMFGGLVTGALVIGLTMVADDQINRLN